MDNSGWTRSKCPSLNRKSISDNVSARLLPPSILKRRKKQKQQSQPWRFHWLQSPPSAFSLKPTKRWGEEALSLSHWRHLSSVRTVLISILSVILEDTDDLLILVVLLRSTLIDDFPFFVLVYVIFCCEFILRALLRIWTIFFPFTCLNGVEPNFEFEVVLFVCLFDHVAA